MIQSEIVDLTTICGTYPGLPENHVVRDAELRTIEMYFKSGVNVILLDGPENMGKTTFLAHYASLNPLRTFSMFIDPVSRFSAEPWLLNVDLINQINWVLEDKEIRDTSSIDDRTLLLKLHALRRFAQKNRREFTFVVDGLDCIPERERGSYQSIVDQLPYGMSPFKFIMSGSLDVLPEKLRKSTYFRSFGLSCFGIEETRKYLSDLVADEHILWEILRTTHGRPGHLASIRRLLIQGEDPRELIINLPEQLPLLFEMEWKRVGDDPTLTQMLAILATDRRPHTLDSLARLLSVPADDAERMLRPLSFVSISNAGQVNYVSASFRSFARTQLRDSEKSVSNTIIQDMMKYPNSNESIVYLPAVLEQQGRAGDLVEYLTTERFSRILEATNSIGALREISAKGVAAAKEINSDPNLVRLVLKTSILEDILSTSISRREIGALMALSDFSAAALLANSSHLVEDRLQLHVALAKGYVQQKMPLDSELNKQIRELYRQVNVKTLGERAFEIASDLLYVAPDLANNLADEAAAVLKDGNARDWAYARLSLRAAAVANEGHCPTNMSKELLDFIDDPLTKKFAEDTAIVLANSTASDVIDQTRVVKDASDRLFMLRMWCRHNRRRSDAHVVVRYALEEVISSTSYSPNARVYRELAEVLPFVQNANVARELVDIFLGQRLTAKRKGPTEEFVRFQLNLARAQRKINTKAAHDTLIDTWFDISSIEDLPLKTTALAWMLTALREIDAGGQLERDEGLYTLVRTDLQLSIDSVLNHTADHFHVTRRIIRALSRTEPQTVESLIKRLNTNHRRNRGHLEMIEVILDVPDLELNAASILSILPSFTDEDLRDEATTLIVDRLSRFERYEEEHVKPFLPVVDYIHRIQNLEDRCEAYCRLFVIVDRSMSTSLKKLASELFDRMEESWEDIDAEWNRAEVGFGLVKMLAKDYPEIAKGWLEKSRLLISFSADYLFIYSLRLSIRALSGLFSQRLDDPSDVQRLRDRIKQIPSMGEQSRLWTELALLYHKYGRIEDCQVIVRDNLYPCLNLISDKNLHARAAAIIFAAPALYSAHSLRAFDEIKKMNMLDRDRAYSAICDYILTKTVPSDPFEYVPGQQHDVDFDDVRDLCEIVTHLKEDWNIYLVLRAICDSVSNRRKFSEEQRAFTSQVLLNVVREKLPDSENILHEGYSIVCRAHLLRLSRTSTRDWEDLIQEARSVPNMSDRAYVLASIAVTLPSKERPLRDKLFEESLNVVLEVPSDKDKIDLYGEIARLAQLLDPQISRKCLSEAAKFATQGIEPEHHLSQRRIIDVAYKIDPDFAASLASLSDSDPARAAAKSNMVDQLGVLKLRSGLLENTLDSNQIHLQHYPQAAWTLLGSLNADLISHQPLESFREYLAKAETLPLKKSFPILLWFIKNMVVRLSAGRSASTIIRPTFEACMEATDLSLSLVARSSNGLRRAAASVARSTDKSSIIVLPGERELGLQVIRSWIEENMTDYVKIQDPYFGPEELSVLRFILSVNPRCSVHILTSIKHHQNERIPQPWVDAYQLKWKQLSVQTPPSTEITLVGIGSGELPIHERWWVSQGKGIKLGKSFNSLGIRSESDIIRLSDDDAIARERTIDQFIMFPRKTSQDGHALVYEHFIL